MASRQAIFGVTGEHGEDNEKLVELFKNRAELKKEFAALNKEKYRLQQMIKEQQGATARIVQRLEHLENLLVDPEWVYTVVVFYQLRALNRRCQGKLAKFASWLAGLMRITWVRQWRDSARQPSMSAAVSRRRAGSRTGPE